MSPQTLKRGSGVEDRQGSDEAEPEERERMPPRTIHQMRKSSLKWGPSARALEACPSAEHAREFLEIEENGKEREAGDRVLAALERAGRI